MDNIPSINADNFRKNTSLNGKNIAMVNRGSYRIGDTGILYKKDLKSLYTKEIQFFRVLKRKHKETNKKYDFIDTTTHII